MAPAVWVLTLPPLLTHSSSACAKLPPRSACASCIVCTHRLGSRVAVQRIFKTPPPPSVLEPALLATHGHA